MMAAQALPALATAFVPQLITYAPSPISQLLWCAAAAAGKNLQAQYERWQPKAKYRTHLDPTVEDVKKLAQSCRRNAKSERVLFHYNGHGVPRPTANGEVRVAPLPHPTANGEVGVAPLPQPTANGEVGVAPLPHLRCAELAVKRGCKLFSVHCRMWLSSGEWWHR